MQLVLRPLSELNSDCGADTAETRGLGNDNSGNSCGGITVSGLPKAGSSQANASVAVVGTQCLSSPQV